MKIVTYNVNGIRSAIRKGFLEWLDAARPDVVCLQEVKAETDQLDLGEFERRGYSVHWHSAQKKGYSGVAILSKPKPLHVEIGCGIERYDFEGRVIRADYEDFSVMSVYMPSGSSGDLRQQFKYEWLDDFYDYAGRLTVELPGLIICGDYNICHKDIDIHNPKRNQKTSGFLPEEREWMDKFVESGFVDSFRYFNSEPHNYTWWSTRADSRAKNLGWRIDYHMLTENLAGRLRSSVILPDAVHSDHCPLMTTIE